MSPAESTTPEDAATIRSWHEDGTYLARLEAALATTEDE